MQYICYVLITYWALEDKGVFSVKSYYRSIRGEQTNVEGGFWKQLWGLKLPGKIINLVWRACRNVLPVASELIKKYVNIDLLCPQCHLRPETPVHVLFMCSFAKELWCKVGLQDVIQVDESATILQILGQAFRKCSREKQVMLSLLCWSIWYRRNVCVWDKKFLSMFGVQSMAMQLLQDWRRSQEELGTRMQRGSNENVTHLCRPPEGWVKVNVDAACRDQLGFIGMGCVARDHMGRFMRARCATMRGGMPPREAEAWSLRAALLWMDEGMEASKVYF
ncbi:uncharacterized protein LOC141685825 [Apium graveolens]|uniref:uncharacterized protein LOC141685825 n=1 Tax=Apium graveolens TaxID=4045 RepID=UPI003D794BDE